MNIKSFYTAYDLTEVDVLKIYSDKNKLYILLGLESNIELIANGYRPEIDVYYKHMFIFDNYDNDININGNIMISNYKCDNNKLSFIANDKEIIINDCNIEVIENYE